MAHKNAPAVKKEVLGLFEDMYGDDAAGGGDVLAVDPNDFDLDPGPFYEMLSERFAVPFDDDNDYFGGFGGTLQHTIDFIASRWDGKTLNEAEGGE